MAKINEREYKKLVKENGGLTAITHYAIKKHGLEKVLTMVFDDNEGYIGIAINMWIDSRMHALEIVKKLLK